MNLNAFWQSKNRTSLRKPIIRKSIGLNTSLPGVSLHISALETTIRH